MVVLFVCPAKDCSGGNGRQRLLSKGEIEVIPQDIKREHNECNLCRCTYCGCVYHKDVGAKKAVILGFLDGGITGPGWKSS